MILVDRAVLFSSGRSESFVFAAGTGSEIGETRLPPFSKDLMLLHRPLLCTFDFGERMIETCITSQMRSKGVVSHKVPSSIGSVDAPEHSHQAPYLLGPN